MSGISTLRGRVAVVTGGASGIGRGIAARFAAEGMDVVIADIEQGALDATAAAIGACGVRTNVADADSVADLAAATVERFGRVDVVVNNAGVGPFGAMESLTLDDWKWILDVNLWGVVHGIDAFLPHLLANPDGGWIVNTASQSVIGPPPRLGSYVASKAAVWGMSEVLAKELASAESAVGVSILIPGPVQTNIKNSTRNRPGGAAGALADHDIAKTMNPAWRWGTPEDVGEIVLRAIRNGDLYVPTHPDLLYQARERHSAIEAAFEKYPITTA